jgi:hypothetical protein
VRTGERPRSRDCTFQVRIAEVRRREGCVEEDSLPQVGTDEGSAIKTCANEFGAPKICVVE